MTIPREIHALSASLLPCGACHLERDKLSLAHSMRLRQQRIRGGNALGRPARPIDSRRPHRRRHAEASAGAPATRDLRARRIALPLYRCGALVARQRRGGLARGGRAEAPRRRRRRRHAERSMAARRPAPARTSRPCTPPATAPSGDDFDALAEALGAGGAMDEDTAYVEAVGSLRALASLQFIGLPIPQDRFGGVLRYQTDHDEVGRATSCGPRTSRLMVKALAEEAMRLGVPDLQPHGRRRASSSTRVRRAASSGCWRSAPQRAARRQSARLRRLPLRRAGAGGRRPRRALSRQRLSQALLRRARPRAGGGNRGGQSHREPVRHRHAARRLSLEPVGHLRAGDALCLFARRRGARAQFPRRLLPHDAGARLQRVPQGLPMAVPCDAHARLRLQPVRSRGLPRDAGGPRGAHGLQPQSRAGSRRRAVLARSGSTPTSAPISPTPTRCWRRRSSA